MDIKSRKPNSPFQDFAVAATPSRKVILVDYSDSEDEDNTCPVKPNEDQEVPDSLWMLESDFIQEGGQAEAIENEPEPDVSELYQIVPYNH